MKVGLVPKIFKQPNEHGETIEIIVYYPAYRTEFETHNKIYNTWVKAKQKNQASVVRGDLVNSRDNSKNYHDQFFAIMLYTFTNLPESFECQNEEVLRKWVLHEIGFVDIIKVKGVLMQFVKSQSFDKLRDQDEFMDKVYNPALDLCCGILAMSREDLIKGSIEQSYNKNMFKGKK